MHIKRPVCLHALIFILIIYIFKSVSGGIDLTEIMPDKTEITVDGVVEDKEYKNNKNILHIRALNTSQNTSFNKFIIELDKQDIYSFKIGQTLRIKGSYSNFPVAQNKGQFCSMSYYRIRGYEARIKKAYVTHASESYSRYRDFLHNVRMRAKDIYYSYMSPENAGTVTAMVLGDKTGLDDETKTLYRNAGISHILSLSGLHIATVGLFIFSVLKKSGAGIYSASFISACLMISYGVMTGMSTSTVRALIMFLLSIAARCLGRTYDLLSAVSLSIVLILFENPLYIYDSGFLMSVFSVLGIGIIYPVLNEVTEGALALNNIADKVRQSVCISLSATIATLPVVMGSFYKLSRYAVFVNIIVVPLMSAVLFLGIFGGITGFLGGMPDGSVGFIIKIARGIGLHKLSNIFLCAVDMILKFYKSISRFSGSLPGNTWVTGEPSAVSIAVYIILIIIAVACVRKGSRKRRFIHVFTFICMAVFVLSYRSENDLSIDVLSVGQGACNIIHGSDIPDIVIDAGSTDVKEAGKYRVIPNLLSKGIDEIDYLFVTHPDDDHINAVKEILADKTCGIKVNALVFSIVDDEILDLSRDYEVPVYSFNAGNVIEGDDYEIRAVYPEYTEGMTWNLDDANEKSLVLKITHKPSGFTALFTGDIGKQAERGIMEQCGNKPRGDNLNNNVGVDIRNVDFMTVAHHGSKNSSSDEFLSYSNPLICTISAGKDNSYGHPHKETLDKLTALKIPYIITYESGEININIDEGKMWVERFLH